jgi:hypothetical protein
MYPLNDLFMSKVEQVESELRKLSQAELRQIREWLDDVIEDELQFTPEFESSIRQSERDMASGKSARVREPEGSVSAATQIYYAVSTPSSSNCHRFCARASNRRSTRSAYGSQPIHTIDLNGRIGSAPVSVTIESSTLSI